MAAHGSAMQTTNEVVNTCGDDAVFMNSAPPQICWLFSKQQLQNTPSSQAGLDAATERRYRRQACELIMKTANLLALGHETMLTGTVFFHRFFMFHSLTSFNRYVVATTCLFLAGKVEETPKKCRDVIKVVRDILEELQQGDIFGADPRDEIVMMEKVVLQTLKFDFTVEHPHKFLAQYYKIFKVADKQRTEKLCQMAWAFANDASLLTLPLEWEPEIIAVATFHLAAQLQKFNVHDFEGKQSRQKWWDGFVENLTTDILDSICHNILDLYEERKRDDQQQLQNRTIDIRCAPTNGDVVENGNSSYQHNDNGLQTVARRAAAHQHQTAQSGSPSLKSTDTTTSPTSNARYVPPLLKRARIGERPRSPPRSSSSHRPPPPPPPTLAKPPPPPPPAHHAVETPSEAAVLEATKSSTVPMPSGVDHGKSSASASVMLPGFSGINQEAADVVATNVSTGLPHPVYAAHAATYCGQNPYASYAATAQPAVGHQQYYVAANAAGHAVTPYGMPMPQISPYTLSTTSNNNNSYNVAVGGNAAAALYNNIPPITSENASQRHGILLLGQTHASTYAVMPQSSSAIQRR